ncbi:MAG: hypothetical protein JEZ12_26585 [Desulfobacterium sp.]|nr:hypothetical protein [Desulfobacterium sp.]
MSDNAAVYREASQDQVAMVALTDDGDHTKFNSADDLWSGRAGYAPNVKSNGVATGGMITPGVVNDTVSVAAMTCYLAGNLTTVAANAALAVVRPETSDYQILSITVTNAGELAVVEGSEHTAFSDIRDAAGGPPLIPVDSIEIGWVKYSAQTAALVLASEIKQVIGTSKETYNYPGWTERRMAVENGALDYAGVDFDSVLPTIHVGGVTKAVFAEYYTPEFAIIPETSDFKPPETTHSTSSKQIYGKTKGSASSTLGQGSFTAYLEDGISDSLITQKNENLFFKFKQNKLNSSFILCQGKLGISREFPADDGVSASCTISAEVAAVEVTA